jgi:hypothetical protein
MIGGAREIAHLLGKAHREGRNWRCVCPLHGGHSLTLRDGSNTLLVKCFAGCATADVLAELRHRGLIEGRNRARRSLPLSPSRASTDRDEDYERQQHQKAQWLWSRSRQIEGTIADTYLRQTRGITCPLPPTLAFLPPRKPEHHPAMIAAFALAHEIEPGVLGPPRNVDAIHLTLLKADGSGKAEVVKPKFSVGSPGSKPIVLAPPNDLLGLTIVEGIETGLSAFMATGLGVWAAGSAGRMPALANEVPDYIECVTIHQENDHAGRRQAPKLAQLLFKRGIEIRIVEAPQ